MNKKITLVECPRDAMQGWQRHIGTEEKVRYLNQLLRVGFNTLDCVSFVNPKAIPQMADSAQVLDKIDLDGSDTKLLAIVANKKGAELAVNFATISYLGFPFSISETFQQLNTNSSILQSWERVIEIQELCLKYGKSLVVYISMGFGNPYGDPYDAAQIGYWVEKMQTAGIAIISLADTVGLATASLVNKITNATISAFPKLEIGVHLHSTSSGFSEKMEAALQAGCLRFDGALKGIGGCPMANNELIGNMDTERMIDFFETSRYKTGVNKAELLKASTMASQLFV